MDLVVPSPSGEEGPLSNFDEKIVMIFSKKLVIFSTEDATTDDQGNMFPSKGSYLDTINIKDLKLPCDRKT